MVLRKYNRKKRIEPPHDATLYGPWTSELRPLVGELEQAIAVREGIFALIRADQGAAVDDEAIRRLDLRGACLPSRLL